MSCVNIMLEISFIDTDRKDFGWSGIYPNAEEPFSFYKSFDSGSCEKLRIECEAYCKNC